MILGVLALSNMHIFMSHIHFKPTLSFKNTVRGPKDRRREQRVLRVQKLRVRLRRQGVQEVDREGRASNENVVHMATTEAFSNVRANLANSKALEKSVSHSG
jgi:hypothetical protein